jgi:hypothetical protein
MELKSVQAFNQDDVERWYDSIVFLAPELPSVVEGLTAREIVSYRLRGNSSFAILNIRLDTGESLTCRVNPLLVQYLRTDLLQAGTSWGWLDHEGVLTVPLIY